MIYYNSENREMKTKQSSLVKETAKNFSESPQAVT